MRLSIVPALLCSLSIAVLLGACASSPRSASAQRTPQPAASTPSAKQGPNRFEMTRNGTRMTADDFDAWMKSRGIRIAEGKKPTSKSQTAKPVAQRKSVKSSAGSTAGSSSQRGTAKR